MAERRRYSKDQKAKVVALATMTSTNGAAEATGIPRKTIAYWLDDPEFAELRQQSKDAVADEFWAAIQIGLKEVANGLKDADVPFRDKAIAFGILYDKHALLTGGATGRTESRDLTGTISDADILAAVATAESLASPVGGEAEATDPPEG